MADCAQTDCVVRVFDIIASLYVNAYQYTYEQIFNGRSDGGGTVDDTVVGAIFTDSSDLEQTIADICFIYRIERAFTSEGLRLYRNAGIEEPNTIVAVIDKSELAITDTASNGIRYEISTTYDDGSNSTTQVAFNFIDADNDYKANQLTAKRPDAIQTDPSKQVSLPFVMHLSDAEKLVNRLLSDGRLALIKHSFRLPPKFAWIGKGDIIQINHGTFSDVVRIIATDFNADKSQSVTAVTVSTTTIEIKTTSHASNSVKVNGALVASEPLFLDIPALNPLEASGDGIGNMFEMYYGVLPKTLGFWLGAYLARQLSSDGEAYATLFHAYGQATKAGSVINRWRTVNALSDKRWVTDSDTLNLSAGNAAWDVSQNTTKTVIGANPLRNLAVYGQQGRWEIIQFEKIVDGVMSGIVRGLRGSEIHCGKHMPDDYVYMLSPGLAMTRLPAARIGQLAKYRAVTEGLPFIGADQIAAPAFEGNSRRPFAPYRFTASRAIDGTITFGWTRRDRVGSGWGKSLINSESQLAFAVMVCDEDGVQLRTLAATDTHVDYTADMQQQDQSSSLTAYQLLISQVGDLGPGFTGKGIVNV